MATIKELERELAQLRAEVRRLNMGLVEFTTISRTSADGSKDSANFAGNPADRQRPIRRISPWGFSGRPLVDVFAGIVKAVGGAFNGLQVGIATDKYGPQDLDEGETAVWNLTKAIIRLWKTGKVTIDAADAAGAPQDVVVQGGTAPVARKNDTLEASSPLGVWAGKIESAINTISTGSIPPGDSFATNVVGPGLLGKISTGAPNFKG